MWKIYRAGHVPLVARKCRRSWNSQVITEVLFWGTQLWPSGWIVLRRQRNLCGRKIWRRISWSWRRSFQQGGYKLIQILIQMNLSSFLRIAGVLSQKQEGVERFLGCWGQKCNCYERNYSSAKAELLALVKYMKKWEHILKYRPPFLVYTDAASLKYIVNLKSEETIF